MGRVAKDNQMRKQPKPIEPERVPCPTVYPSRTTYGRDYPPEGFTEHNVPCGAMLRQCNVCKAVRYCGREGHCLDSQLVSHVVHTKFEIDGCDYGYPGGLPGWTRGEHWNGWECPRFEKPEAMAIMAAQAEFGGKGQYDEATDTFVLELEGYDEPDKYPGTDIETPEGVKHVYALGAWAWCWDEVEPRCDFCHGDHVVDECPNIDPEQWAIELQRRQAEKGKG
jgi:hypothetical protein